MIAFEYSYQTHTQTKRRSFDPDPLVLGRRDADPDPTAGTVGVTGGRDSRMFGKLFNADMQLESEEFDRAFTVTSDDRKLASAILHPRTMEGLRAYRAGLDIRRGDFVSVTAGNLDRLTVGVTPCSSRSTACPTSCGKTRWPSQSCRRRCGLTTHLDHLVGSSRASTDFVWQIRISSGAARQGVS